MLPYHRGRCLIMFVSAYCFGMTGRMVKWSSGKVTFLPDDEALPELCVARGQLYLPGKEVYDAAGRHRVPSPWRKL